MHFARGSDLPQSSPVSGAASRVETNLVYTNTRGGGTSFFDTGRAFVRSSGKG